MGRERSLRLKLVRRMAITRVRSAKGRVTISGRVIGPLADPIASIVVRRRVSCSRTVVARRVRPSRNGRFRVTLAGPPRALAATYRFETKVRRKTTNPKLFPTFTLPHALYHSANIGQPVTLNVFPPDQRPGMHQEIQRPAVRPPKMVHA